MKEALSVKQPCCVEDTSAQSALKLALEALEWINRVNAMDYEYQEKAREALSAINEALAQPEQEPENRCVRELREFAKSNQGVYIFPSWDGHRVLKYLGDTTTPQRDSSAMPLTWVGLSLADKEEYLALDFGGNRLDAMDWAEKRLKEKNT